MITKTVRCQVFGSGKFTLLGVDDRLSGVALIRNSCSRRGQMAGCTVPVLMTGKILQEAQLWAPSTEDSRHLTVIWKVGSAQLRVWVGSKVWFAAVGLGWGFCCCSGQDLQECLLFDPVSEQSASEQSFKKGFAYLGFLAFDLWREQIYILIKNSIINMLSCVPTLLSFSNMVLVKSTSLFCFVF